MTTLDLTVFNDPVLVEVTAPATDVVLTPSVVTVDVTAQSALLEVTPPAATAVTVSGTTYEVVVSPAGAVGPAGDVGPAGPVELFDSATAPVSPPATYLRFERDLAGDVQAIYLGTVD